MQMLGGRAETTNGAGVPASRQGDGGSPSPQAAPQAAPIPNGFDDDFPF